MLTRRGLLSGSLLTGAATATEAARGANSSKGGAMLRGTVMADNAAPGDPIEVLIDGADTSTTVNAVGTNFKAVVGDRVLVSRVGAQLEAVQSLTTTTLYVEKTANETVASSTVMQDDNELFFPVEANGIYLVDFNLFWEASGALSGFQAEWGLPAGSKTYGHSVTREGSATPWTFVTKGSDPNWGETGFFIGFGELGYGIGAVDRLGTFGRHRLQIGATAGVCQLRWAQFSVHATNTRLFAESSLFVQRVG